VPLPSPPPHYPNFSSFPAFNQEKLGLAAKAFVLVKAVA
jgi:hypothetical protein